MDSIIVQLQFLRLPTQPTVLPAETNSPPYNTQMFSMKACVNAFLQLRYHHLIHMVSAGNVPYRVSKSKTDLDLSAQWVQICSPDVEFFAPALPWYNSNAQDENAMENIDFITTIEGIQSDSKLLCHFLNEISVNDCACIISAYGYSRYCCCCTITLVEDMQGCGSANV